jgi:hypothetical protein
VIIWKAKNNPNSKFDTASGFSLARFGIWNLKILEIKKAQLLSCAFFGGYYIWFNVLLNFLKCSSLFDVAGFKTFFKPVHSLF